MSHRRTWFKKLSTAATSLLAIGATAAPATVAFGQEALSAAPAEASKSTVADEYPDLDTAASQARLKEIQADETMAAALKTVSDELASGKASAQDIEAAVLPLIEGRDPQDAELSLDAVMLEQYRSHVKGKAKDTPAAAKLLEARDKVLTEAAFGALSKKKHIKNRRAIKMHRR